MQATAKQDGLGTQTEGLQNVGLKKYRRKNLLLRQHSQRRGGRTVYWKGTKKVNLNSAQHKEKNVSLCVVTDVT